jgi:hypothetical protein
MLEGYQPKANLANVRVGSIASFWTGVPDFRSTLNNGPWRNPLASLFGAKMGSRAYWQIDGESVPQKKPQPVNGYTTSCDTSHGSSTILPPSPPASIRAWTFFAAANGSRAITTG